MITISYYNNVLPYGQTNPSILLLSDLKTSSSSDYKKFETNLLKDIDAYNQACGPLEFTQPEELDFIID